MLLVYQTHNFPMYFRVSIKIGRWHCIYSHSTSTHARSQISDNGVRNDQWFSDQIYWRSAMIDSFLGLHQGRMIMDSTVLSSFFCGNESSKWSIRVFLSGYLNIGFLLWIFGYDGADLFVIMALIRMQSTQHIHRPCTDDPKYQWTCLHHHHSMVWQ